MTDVAAVRVAPSSIGAVRRRTTFVALQSLVPRGGG
jgi:hypothetical protein